jgi:hypothetical protein
MSCCSERLYRRAVVGIEQQLGAITEDQVGGDAEERGLLDGSVVDFDQLREGERGTNETWIVTFDGTGERAFYKPINGINGTVAHMFGLQPWEVAICEAAAWRVAAQLGPPWSSLMPPCVIRWIERIDDRAPGSLSAERFGNRERSLQALLHDPQACLRAAFLDALIGNMDRGIANFLFDDSRGELAIIDHGFAFPNDSGTMNCSELLDWRHRLGLAALRDEEREALELVLDTTDCCGVACYLGDRRADAMIARAQTMKQQDRVVQRVEVLP